MATPTDPVLYSFRRCPLPHLQGWLADHLASGLFEMIRLRVTFWSPDDTLDAATLPQHNPGDLRS
jgi:hypothetical protein